ncbi:sigma-54 interaction domain-containing protein [Azotosporobacter soli]|uniref:sigma-54 interaction domain-containing protein n=1 Tax=Azotosporobacter soli TaxID=3055040 RepID=UPI0031FF0F1A
MRSIAVVTNKKNSPLGAFLKSNLESVFAGYIEINVYAFAELHSDDILEDDLVLVMLNDKALEIKKHISAAQPIVVVQRTTRESEVFKLLAIPTESKVLVVNDCLETTFEMVALLYKLGVNHVKFVPYEEEKEYKDINFAVTPGAAHRVPDAIEHVIDMGHRYIDVATFIEIINKLAITEEEVSRRLLQYCDSIVVLDGGIKKQYKEIVAKNTELSTVINLSQEGVLLLNAAGDVSLYNNSLARMLDIEEANGCVKNGATMPSVIMNAIRQLEMKDEIIEYKGKTLVVNRKKLECFGETTGNYYNFQEVTYIKQLEQNLTRKLRDKGLVARYSFADIQTNSAKMKTCIELARKIAQSEMTILITGESGTGKELLAQSIHNASARAKQPFVAFNCAAVPESLLESELFGYERGSFTGGLKEGKLGLFEQANNGTVFLDEIGDMSYEMQAKLLRVLQERQVMRIGSQSVVNINIRVIAATNSDIRKKIRLEQFREDLYYRLNVLPLVIPPLRERREDIIYLLEYFLHDKYGKKLSVDVNARELLMKYRWPGNIRELDNVASYLSFMAESMVKGDDLPYYILQSEENYEQELQVLTAKGLWDKGRDVLQVIADFGALDMGAGRKSIDEALKNRGIRLTEGEIRRELALLGELELIKTSIGRRGSEITFKGKSFLNWVGNRVK